MTYYIINTFAALVHHTVGYGVGCFAYASSGAAADESAIEAGMIDIMQSALFSVVSPADGATLDQAYGGQLDGPRSDVNNDGVVDATDMALVLNAVGTASPDADVNADGAVDLTDFDIVLIDASSPEPPPAPLFGPGHQTCAWVAGASIIYALLYIRGCAIPLITPMRVGATPIYFFANLIAVTGTCLIDSVY